MCLTRIRFGDRLARRSPSWSSLRTVRKARETSKRLRLKLSPGGRLWFEKLNAPEPAPAPEEEEQKTEVPPEEHPIEPDIFGDLADEEAPKV